MAVFNNFYPMIIFIITITLLVDTGFSSVILDNFSAPSPSSPYPQSVTQCAAKLNSDLCKYEIYFGYYAENLGYIDRECCSSIVHDLGKSCHDIWTRALVKLPDFREREISILNFSNTIWNYCSGISV